MLEVSPKVVRHNVSCKIQEWLSTNRKLFFSKTISFHFNLKKEEPSTPIAPEGPRFLQDFFFFKLRYLQRYKNFRVLNIYFL